MRQIKSRASAAVGLGFLLAASTGHIAQANEVERCRNQLFATGFDGAPISGSKQALIDAVQRGEPIRVGWDLDFNKDGVSDLSHWAGAEFLTVFEGEVFAQIEAIHAQRPVRNKADVELPGGYVEWRGSLATTGTLDGAYSDERQTPADVKVRIHWCSTAPAGPVWTPVYKNGANGEALEGSRELLLAAIRAGQPIQIGWGVSAEREGERISVEHLVAPVFITITNEYHVVAQLPEHIAQQSYWDVDEAFFENGAVMWRGVMTTKGAFDAIWVNRSTGEIVRRAPQRAVLTWYVQQKTARATPSLAIPDGVIADETRADKQLPR